MNALLRTPRSIPLLVVRLTAGAVMLPHGLQKTLGLFGGYGFSGTMKFFTETVGVPWVLALVAILAESLGSLGLIFGVFARVAALGVASVMVVAVAKGGHLQHGFFMNWSGNQAGEGFEYHLLMLGMCLAVLIGGAGSFSYDRHVSSKLPAFPPLHAGM
ncbi:MAG: DoxX family protein [Planctomycetes bacterium]|nr:DoxX family protein [Planctomycetota bacterium]